MAPTVVPPGSRPHHTNPLATNPALINASNKSLIESIKTTHKNLIANFPAYLVLSALEEHSISNASGIGSPPCGSGSTSGCVGETASTDNYTAAQWNSINNDLTLAQQVPQGFGLALIDSFGNLQHIYQEKKVFTMNKDGTTYEWTFDDTENQKNPKKSTVTDKNFIEFFKSMKTLSTSFPSLPDDEQFTHKVFNLGEDLGYLIISIYKVKLNDNSEIGYVAKFSGFDSIKY